MTKAHLAAEQIVDFLQQSKNGVSNKVLCEKYEFSVSTLHRWQKQRTESTRRKLEQLGSTGAIVFLFSFISATLLTIMFSKSLSTCMMSFLLAYCVGYIRQFRKVSAEHIQEENIFLACSGRGVRSTFYHFNWAYIALFVFAVGYIIVRMI